MTESGCRGFRAVPGLVWAITALWGSLLLGASLVWPMGTGLDETAHIDMAYSYAAHPFTFYGPGQLQYSKAVAALSRPSPPISSGLAALGSSGRLSLSPDPPRQDRPTLAQLGGHARVTGGQPDQMVEHPPLYYWLEAAVLSVPGVSGLAWDVQVWLMRLLSVVLMLPIPLLCWGAARRLLAGPLGQASSEAASRVALLGAVLPLTIPDLLRDGSSVDNDTLLVLLTSIVLYGMARVLSGDLGTRTAALIAVAVAAALWTKGFALGLPPVVVLAYLLGARLSGPSEHLLRRVWRPLLVVLAASLVGASWWVRNLIDFHTLQPNGFGAFNAVIRGPVDDKGTLAGFLPPFLDQFGMRIWGELGLPDSPAPAPIIVYGWLTVVGIGLLTALTVKGPRGQRRAAAVMGLVPLTYFAIVAEGAYVDFVKWSHRGVQAAQGRYIYGGVVAISALFVLGCRKLLRPSLHARLPLIVTAAALLTNASAWVLILRSWYNAPDDRGYGLGIADGIHTLLNWSPLPAGVTILLVCLLPLACGATCLLRMARDLRTPESQPPLHTAKDPDQLDERWAAAPRV